MYAQAVRAKGEDLPAQLSCRRRRDTVLLRCFLYEGPYELAESS